jgi:uncharacterized protein
MKVLPRFLWLVLLFSLPLWLAATFIDATKIIPVRLPFSALQFFSVFLAAIVVTRNNSGSVSELLSRGIDVQRIKNPAWLVGIFILMPITIAVSYVMLLWSGANVSTALTPLLNFPLFLLIYGISGYCEEVGWTAVMTDRLLAYRSTIMTGFIVGTTWALWHLIPFIQTHNTASWIFWQCIFTVIFRVLLVKVFILTNRSVFSTIAMHAMYDAAFSMMPYYGSSYNPLFMAFATILITLIVFASSNIFHRREQLSSVSKA